MKNKKRISLLLITVLLLSVFLPVHALSGEILINGERIDAPAPYIHKEAPDAVMVPLRAIAEKLGLKVIWQQEEKKIILGYGIELQIGNSEYVTDFTTHTKIDPAPELTGGSTFVPLDFIRYALEYDAYMSDGKVVIGESTSSTDWITFEGNTIWFSEDAPYEYCSDSETIRVGKDQNGGDVFSLIRMTLRGDWLASEVAGARLFLKVAEGTPPDEINVGIVAKSWGPSTIQRDMVAPVILENSFVITEVKREDNGWVSMDVTDMVKMWLGGEKPNRGFALYPTDDDALGVFVSGTPGRSAYISDAPRIVINGAAGERSDSYGRFGFTKQPVQGFPDPIVGGNCLSYALRDIDGIFSEDLPHC